MTNMTSPANKYEAISNWENRVTWAASSKSLAVIDSNCRIAIEQAAALTSQYEFRPKSVELIQQVVNNLNFVRDNILTWHTSEGYRVRARLSEARRWAMDARLFA